jgi:diguanylate cyclase (GGDEF)-like protein
MKGLGATWDSIGLEAVCRAALAALGAVRITVWSADLATKTFSPHVSVAGADSPPVASGKGLIGGWAQTPVSDLPPFAEALERRRPVVITNPAAGGGRMAHLATDCAMGTAHCEPLYEGVSLGVLVVEPKEAAAQSAAIAILVAAATSGLARRERRAEAEATSSALLHLLETGVRACSPMEAAEALAATAAKVLGFPTACAYLVDDDGYITEMATVGAAPGLADKLRSELVGRLASASPGWRRTVEGHAAGPDLISDTTLPGLVRKGGIAEVLGLRSLAAIPLLSSDGPLGLVLCGDSKPRQRWRKGDRELLARLALEGTVVVDNARLRAAERHEAGHDALTGLLNRRAFSEQFRNALDDSAQSGEPLAVVVIDLDGFKEVNDRLGHHRGDELLVEVGRRLRSIVGQDAIVARMGGDEFALVLTEHGDLQGAEDVAGRIRKACNDPIELGDQWLSVVASIGLALSPEQGRDVDQLLQQADLAMYVAKRSGPHKEARAPGMNRLHLHLARSMVEG